MDIFFKMRLEDMTGPVICLSRDGINAKFQQLNKCVGHKISLQIAFINCTT
jgi:hypothetical protein